MNFETEIIKKYLPLLLKNMATGKDFDFDYERDFKPGYERNKEEQKKDGKNRAAIFTPAHVVRNMTGYLVYEKFIKESKYGLDSNKLLNATFIEPCCGEAPFIVMRYNAVTGETIAIEDRDGILDKKIKNAHNVIWRGCPGLWCETTYFEWYENVAKTAFKTVFGIEKHIPSLIIARLNLLLSFIEYSRLPCPGNKIYKKEFELHGLPYEEHIREIAEIINWNFWQMDFFNPKDEVFKDWKNGEVIKWADYAKACKKENEALKIQQLTLGF